MYGTMNIKFKKLIIVLRIFVAQSTTVVFSNRYVVYLHHTHTTDTFIFAASSAREHSAMQ
jgi:hypothetical protein